MVCVSPDQIPAASYIQLEIMIKVLAFICSNLVCLNYFEKNTQWNMDMAVNFFIANIYHQLDNIQYFCTFNN